MWPILLALIGIGIVAAQYTSQTYPDPRLDPITCRLPLSSLICDPSSVLSDEERLKLAHRLNQLRTMTAGIRNTSPACAMQADKTLDVFVIIIDKIGTIPSAPVDIEKFSNNLKRRFQNYQDVSACDTAVVIVNSKQDRQNVDDAGPLKEACSRNPLNIRNCCTIPSSRTANSFHKVKVFPSINTNEIDDNDKSNYSFEDLIKDAPSGFDEILKRRKLLKLLVFHKIFACIWVTIMQQAVARCGSQPELLPVYVRAVVEEAMSISLKLITDSRYNSIEEEVEANKDVTGMSERKWLRLQSTDLVYTFIAVSSTFTMRLEVIIWITTKTQRSAEESAWWFIVMRNAATRDPEGVHSESYKRSSFTVQFDECDPMKAIGLSTELIRDKNVDVIIGPSCSAGK
ncbi:hypothetical protein KIN20_016391 [Parelaphostrongylus tenuis]|uniref:VWFA domain-containing protein n=1 Tax=Parelaphostrongylus tenuis TaxID=148309 RepID=A0AAD5N1C0_PARTN|nr:hypothetical protein KIN20_016391 [Parelaphostrongylus tenuis]